MRKGRNQLALALGLISVVIALSLVVISTQTNSPTAAVVGIEEIAPTNQTSPEYNPQAEQEPNQGSSDLGTDDATLSTMASISACGEINESSVLTASFATGSSLCFNITASNIIFDGAGFTVTGPGTSGTRGIVAKNRNNVTIKNFGLVDFFSTINFTHSNDINIINNHEINNGESNGGLPSASFVNTTNILINNNSFTGNTSSTSFRTIEVNASENLNISNNIIHGATSVYIHFTANTTIEKNTINATRYGTAIVVLDQNGTLIRNNNITIVFHDTATADAYGITTSRSNHNIIENNKINQSASDPSHINGLLIVAGSNNTYRNNDIEISVDQIVDFTGSSNLNTLIYNNANGSINWTLTDLDTDTNLVLGESIVIEKNNIGLEIPAPDVLELGSLNLSSVITFLGLDNNIVTNVTYNGAQCANSDNCNITSTGNNQAVIQNYGFPGTATLRVYQTTGVNVTTNCGYINNNTILTNNIKVNGSCFIINASNIFLDGGGYNVIGNGSGIGINNTNFTNVTLRSFRLLSNFTNAIYVDSLPARETNNTIYNNTIYSSSITDEAIIRYASGGRAYRDNITQNLFVGFAGGNSRVIQDTRRATIAHNTFYLNDSANRAISLANSGSAITIENNTFIATSQGEGDILSFSAGSTNHVIKNNTLEIWNNNSNVLATVLASHFLLENNNITIYGTNTTWLRLTTGGSNFTFINNRIESMEMVINDSISTSKLLIYNNSFGQITWNKTDLSTNMNLSLAETIFIEDNNIGIIDTNRSLNLNDTATITFRSLAYGSTPFLLKNGVRCDENESLCNITSYSAGTLIAQVSSFSNYTTQSSSGVCRHLNSDYTLTQNVQVNLTMNESCFIINASHITLDGAGFSLIGNGTGMAVNNSENNVTNVTIKNFALISNFTTSVDITSVESIIITNNTILAANTTSSQAIQIRSVHSNQSNISHNNISTFASLSSAIDIQAGSDNATIQSNTILTTGNRSFGIEVSTTAQSASVISNNITTRGNLSVGLNLGATSGILVSDNSIQTNNNLSYALTLEKGVGGLVRNNQLSVRAAQNTPAISFQSSATGLVLLNNNISSSSTQKITTNGLSHTLIYNNSFGAINWTKANLSTNVNVSLQDPIILENNNIGLIDKSGLLELNGTATITFFGLGYSTTPYLLKNGVRCDENESLCNITSYSAGTLIAEVSSFSNYTTQEASTICGFLNNDYTLTQNVQSNGTCFIINASHITLDGAGFNLTGNTSGSAVNDSGVFTNVTIKNFGLIDNFMLGIDLDNVENSTITNNTIQTANVTNARGIAASIGAEGINISNNDLTAIGPDGNVILANGHRIIIHSNIVTANAFSTDGIVLTSANATVSFNNISGNGSGAFPLYSQTKDSIIFNNTVNDIRTYYSFYIGTATKRTLIRDNTFFAVNNSAIFFQGSPANTTLVNNNISASFTPVIGGVGSTNSIIYNNSFGQINWTKTNFTTNVNVSLQDPIIIEDNLIGLVDKAGLLKLNETATITFFGLNHTITPKLLRNGVRCDDQDICNITSYSAGTLIADVSSFSNYTTQAFSSCGYINSDTTLTNNIRTNGTCFTINASNIFLDGAGFNLTGNTSGFGINNTGGQTNVTIRGFNFISNFSVAMNFTQLNSTTITNNTIRITQAQARGIELTSSNSNAIEDNTVASTQTASAGIFLTSSQDNTLRNNNLSLSTNAIINDTTSSAIQNTLIYNNSFGEINWTKNNLTTKINLSLANTIFIENNNIGLVDSAATLSLNDTAIITFYGLTHDSTPQLRKNDVRCDDNASLCNITSYSAGTLIAQIASFSNYTTFLESTTTTTTGGGGGGGRAPSSSAPLGQSCPQGSVNVDNECHEIWCDNNLDDDRDGFIDCDDSDCSEKEVCNKKEQPAQREEVPVLLSQEGKKFRLWWVWLVLALLMAYIGYLIYQHRQSRPHPIPTFIHKPKGFIFPVWNKHFKHLSWHDKFQAVNKALAGLAQSVPASYRAITKVKTPKKVRSARKSIKPTIIPIPKGAVKLQNELARIEKQIKTLHIKATKGTIIENVWASHGHTHRSWNQRKALKEELKKVSTQLRFGPEDVRAQQSAQKEVKKIAKKVDALPQSKQMTKLQKELIKIEEQLQDLNKIAPHGAILSDLATTHGHTRMGSSQKRKLRQEFEVAIKELGLKEKPKRVKRVYSKTRRSRVPFFAGTNAKEK